MKKSIFTLAIVSFVMGSIFTSCKPNTEKEQAAQENLDSAKVAVTNAQNELIEAKRAATAEEWQVFKDDTDAKIEDNTAKIAELKLKIKKTGKEIDKEYQKKNRHIGTKK